MRCLREARMLSLLRDEPGRAEEVFALCREEALDGEQHAWLGGVVFAVDAHVVGGIRLEAVSLD